MAFLIGSAEMAEEKHHYLQQVERFCARVQNDWYRVYLVRKLTSQQGMAFVQSLSKEGHPARWVFPKEVLAQQVRRAVRQPQCCLSSPVPPTPGGGLLLLHPSLPFSHNHPGKCLHLGWSGLVLCLWISVDPACDHDYLPREQVSLCLFLVCHPPEKHM